LNRYFYFIIFAFSGFAGLIYESIWTHYLKLFLGHAAYAQVLVLSIFMGGLAIGAWLAGRYGPSIRNLFLGYAAVEALIGLLAIIFHPLFIIVTDFSYHTIIPTLNSPSLISLFKWTLSALLILPQSILLGTTFPLMSAGLIRHFPETLGHSLAMLYFTNSLGAAIGVLVSGFILIKAVGLPGTILTAGLLNILIALIIWLRCQEEKPVQPQSVHYQPILLILLGCAGLTGASSFLYEIAWIRMLTLVLGASTHSFELMLSAFILGLALGGFWIRKRLDNFSQPMIALGIIQIVMGLLALSTLLFYGQLFDLMSYILNALNRTESGYVLFNLSSHIIAMLVMLPTTICAGMTLPLLTYYLIQKGYGESAIGNIYAANTFGAIIGIVIGAQFIMPQLGVKNLITIGSGIDIFLGLGFLWYAGRWSLTTATTGTLLVAAAMWGIELDPLKMSSGVFRSGTVTTTGKQILFHQDGKTSTVSLFKTTENEASYITLSTNGKPDASIAQQGKPLDEITMILAGVLPYAIKPDIKTVANIGMGAGVTSHVLLEIPPIEQLDTIEIEEAVVAGIKGLGNLVENNFKDPRAHIYIEDAKTYFSTYRKTYDLIISEPSNPWVSGVAGLFSEEFYRVINRYLNQGGIFAQWVQLYEIDISLLASIVKAISNNFENYVLYLTNEFNVLIIASKAKELPELRGKILEFPKIVTELANIGVFHLSDLQLRYVGSQRTLNPLFNSYEMAANSDYFPVLDLNAVKARYLRTDVRELAQLRGKPLPLMEILENRPAANLAFNETPYFTLGQEAKEAKHIFYYFQSLAEGKLPNLANLETSNLALINNLISLLQPGSLRENPLAALKLDETWLYYLKIFASATLPYLSPSEMASIWKVLATSSSLSTLSEPAKNWLNLYQAVGNRDLEQMLHFATLLLPAAGNIVASPDNHYLLATAMLAYVAVKQPNKALELGQRYVLSPETPLPIELRLLYAVAALSGG